MLLSGASAVVNLSPQPYLTGWCRNKAINLTWVCVLNLHFGVVMQCVDLKQLASTSSNWSNTAWCLSEDVRPRSSQVFWCYSVWDQLGMWWSTAVCGGAPESSTLQRWRPVFIHSYVFFLLALRTITASPHSEKKNAGSAYGIWIVGLLVLKEGKFPLFFFLLYYSCYLSVFKVVMVAASVC